LDYVWVTNQDGRIVDGKGCELTRTQLDPSRDRDLDVWECLEDNPNPGFDQRLPLVSVFGDPITERRKRSKW
jgi:hypothetical protein